MCKIHHNVLEVAIEECKKSNMTQKMSAVIFKDKNILSLGHNRLVSPSPNPQLQYLGVPYPYSIHAEVDAILNYEGHRRNLRSASIFIFRQRKIKGKITVGLAKPCKCCKKVIRSAEIQKVFWTENDGDIGTFI